MKRFIITIVFLCATGVGMSAQSVALDRLGKDKWFKYSGGISAMGLFYDGAAPRDPFGYHIRGALDITLAGMYRLPFSFNYSDQQFRFPSPIKLNRFSFHPSYKGLQLHFGDAAMSFSPYTLSGHQFTGFGAEYKGDKPWSLGLMYGRLLKRVDYREGQPGIIPVHERRGYGLKLGYTDTSWGMSAVIFSARDKVASSTGNLRKFPFPERNVVIGLQGRWTVLKKASVLVDYAHSIIGLEGEGLKGYYNGALADSLLGIGDEKFRALKVSMNYPAFSGNLAVAYERIDPGYRTFGAYYFNADLENISIAASQSIFNGKVNLQLRSGVQRDNLDKAKNSEFRRLVNSLEVGYVPEKNLSLNAHYSNFLTHTNARDQFDRINQVSPLDVIDTLAYRQLAQQASLSMQYGRTPASGNFRTWSAVLNFQENKDQGQSPDSESTGDQFYQGGLHYDVRSETTKWQYGFTVNASLHRRQHDRRLTWGPGFSAGKNLFQKKLRTRLLLNYNLTEGVDGDGGHVFNTRLNASWKFYQEQQLGFTGGYQYRAMTNYKGGDLTLQLNYNYRFDNFRLHLQHHRSQQQPRTPALMKVSFRYRDVLYSGTIPEVNRQLALVSREPRFIALPVTARKELTRLQKAYLQQDKRSAYKFHALHYLGALYHYGDAMEAYYREADMAVRKIIHDMKGTDHELERRYVRIRDQWEDRSHSLREAKRQDEVEALEYAYRECSLRLKGHRWLEQELKDYEGLSFRGAVHPAIRTYLDRHLQEHITAITEGTSPESLRPKLEVGLIDHLYHSSLKYTTDAPIILRYHHLKSK